MAAGFPTKANWATGDVLTAAQMDDLAGTVNLLAPTAKGSIKAGSAANTVTDIAVGTNGQVLTADSTATGGVKWADGLPSQTGQSGNYLTTNGTTASWGAVSSGGMTLLSTTSLSGTSTVVSSISQSYTNLIVVIQNPYTNSGSNLVVRPNSTANQANGNRIANGTAGNITGTDFNGQFALPTTSDPLYSNYYLQLNNYTDTTYGKNYQWSCFISNSSGVGTQYWGVWANASAISSIQVTTSGGSATFSGGRVLIYGVK